MQDNHPGRVEDYTTASLVLIFVNMLWIFVWICSVWGLTAIIILAAILNHLITRLERSWRRTGRFEANASRGVTDL